MESLIDGESSVAVSAYDSQDKVAEIFANRRLPLVAVVDKEGRLVGSISSETGLKLVEEREVQRLTTFGGLVAVGGPDIDILRTPLMRIYKARVFWLVVLTFFELLTSTFHRHRRKHGKPVCHYGHKGSSFGSSGLSPERYTSYTAT